MFYDISKNSSQRSLKFFEKIQKTVKIVFVWDFRDQFNIERNFLEGKPLFIDLRVLPYVILVIIQKRDFDELLADFKILQDDSMFNAVLITKVIVNPIEGDQKQMTAFSLAFFSTLTGVSLSL